MNLCLKCIKCSIIAKINQIKGNAQTSGSLIFSIVIRRRDVWLESVCSQLLMSWRQGWSGIISSLYLTNTHSRLFISATEKRETDGQTEGILSRHNSKDMKPRLKPRRQVRSGYDHTQNKPLLNLDGFFHLSHMHDYWHPNNGFTTGLVL